MRICVSMTWDEQTDSCFYKNRKFKTVFQTLFDEYEDPCVHGFFNRGNLSDPGVAECVDTAMRHLLTFMEEHLLTFMEEHLVSDGSVTLGPDGL